LIKILDAHRYCRNSGGEIDFKSTSLTNITVVEEISHVKLSLMNKITDYESKIKVLCDDCRSLTSPQTHSRFLEMMESCQLSERNAETIGANENNEASLMILRESLKQVDKFKLDWKIIESKISTSIFQTNIR